VGSLTGAAVRAVGTPVAMAGAALRTSFQNGEGVKGFGKAWKEMTGVQEGGFKNNMKTVGRSAQIMGTSVVSGLNGATDAIYMQRQMDSLDRMRP
jgi:type IV secretory pathway TrbL component